MDYVSAHAHIAVNYEPTTSEETTNCPEKPSGMRPWAMGKETVAERQLSLGADYAGRKALTCKWVYKVKMND